MIINDALLPWLRLDTFANAAKRQYPKGATKITKAKH